MAVLTSTHNLCFGAKIRKKVYPCIPQFCYINDIRGYILHGHVILMICMIFLLDGASLGPLLTGKTILSCSIDLSKKKVYD